MDSRLVFLRPLGLRLYRSVVVLRHFEELSYEEMSEVLQIPEKTVKSRLFSARQQLKTMLLQRVK